MWMITLNNMSQQQMQKTSTYEEKKSVLLTEILRVQITKWKKLIKKSLYKASTKQQQWVRENHNHKKHEKINWKECINK